ncbi:C2H2-type zinc finger protein [Aquimarina agarilytica]|uniref:C2H2-type zinc finger protein n=1 Tax=Aquimarina agarilytica TaxID=1087449 RepID=UPI000289E826|nr:C2H2-type zinc finger protein [Aquimarina agarilytica]
MKKLILNEAFGIFALSLLLVPQVAHTVYVFKINSQYHAPWWSWAYALGVDLAVLIFTVKGWKKVAIAYFFGTLAHNLVYQFYPESVWSALLICVMLSATIFSFSHLFYSGDKLGATENTEVRSESSLEVKRIHAILEAGIQIEMKPFKCPECGECFAIAKQLNGHISTHKKQGEWFAENYGDYETKNLEREALVKKSFS